MNSVACCVNEIPNPWVFGGVELEFRYPCIAPVDTFLVLETARGLLFLSASGRTYSFMNICALTTATDDKNPHRCPSPNYMQMALIPMLTLLTRWCTCQLQPWFGSHQPLAIIPSVV